MYADHHISPFEGSPRASTAEYVLGGMLVKGGCYKPTNQIKKIVRSMTKFRTESDLIGDLQVPAEA